MTKSSKLKKSNKKLDTTTSQASIGGVTTTGPTFYEFTEVFVWGDDQFGQLGLYHQKLKKGTSDQLVFKLPKTCSFNILIKQVSCGEHHSAILTNQGHLYMMGSNSDGQLGIGDNCPDMKNKECAGAPCLVDTLRDLKISQVTCGRNFTFCITSSSSDRNSQVYAWGSNRVGQLGLSETENELMFDKVESPLRINSFKDKRIIQISAGYEHSLFLNDKGDVFGAGSNSQGQLGLKEIADYITEPTMIEALQDNEIGQVSAGYFHSLFLTQQGEVYACGSNQQFQLGINEVQTQINKPSKIQTLMNYKIIKIEAKSHSAAISQNGELFLWGKGVFGQYRVPQKILTISNQVKSVSLGGSLGAAVDCKGLLWTWGSNSYGELGVGDNDPRVHPYPVLTLKGKQVSQIACGGSFVIALGNNLKKEIPGLNLKKQSLKDSSHLSKRRGSIKHNSSQKSLSKSHSKKRTSSTSNLQRKDSIVSINKIYGGNGLDLRQITAATVQSPKQQFNKLQKILQKRHSKSSLHVKSAKESSSKSQHKPKQLKIKGSKQAASQPFSGEETTVLKSSNNHPLNQSVNLNKKTFQIAHLRKISNGDLDSTNQENNDHMFIPPQSLTNKEKLIKDLSNENKQLKIEADLFKKEQRALKAQMEQLEKQFEKSKVNQQHATEIQNLYHEIKKKEHQLAESKRKKNQYKEQMQKSQTSYERIKEERDNYLSERQQLIQQIDLIQNEYKSLQDKYFQSQQKNESYEGEIKEFQRDLQQISDQSKDVERSLLDKLQQVSEKYKQAIKDLEDVKLQSATDKKKLSELATALKDNQFYTNAIERENAFLREEIEKAKYSKDKAEYGRFIQGLVPIKGKKLQQTQDENNNERQPFQEQNQQDNIKSNQDKVQEEARNFLKKSMDFGNSSFEPKILTQQSADQNENNQQSQKDQTDWNELKMSYNQKLLKSIEKKTLKENKYR